MPSSCKDIRKPLHATCFPIIVEHQQLQYPHTNEPYPGQELALCLQHSDCMFIHRNKAGDCLRAPLRDTLPPQCRQLQKSYANCRKGWVDMRKRFRGNRPISVSQEIEADASGVGYQLYAGAPAFTSVKGTDGREKLNTENDEKEGGE